jgi:hypothetical protein
VLFDPGIQPKGLKLFGAVQPQQHNTPAAHAHRMTVHRPMSASLPDDRLREVALEKERRGWVTMGLGRGVWDGGDAAMGGKLNEKRKLGQDRLCRRTLKNPIAPNTPDYPNKPKCPDQRCRNTTAKDPLFPHLANCRTLGMT